MRFLEAAVHALEQALEIFVRDVHPVAWGEVHKNFSHVYETMGDINRNTSRRHYEQALDAIERALEVLDQDNAADSHADAVSARQRLDRKVAKVDADQ